MSPRRATAEPCPEVLYRSWLLGGVWCHQSAAARVQRVAYQVVDIRRRADCTRARHCRSPPPRPAVGLRFLGAATPIARRSAASTSSAVRWFSACSAREANPSCGLPTSIGPARLPRNLLTSRPARVPLPWPCPVVKRSWKASTRSSASGALLASSRRASQHCQPDPSTRGSVQYRVRSRQYDVAAPKFELTCRGGV